MVDYQDVTKSGAAMKAMLKASGGKREVPVIVDSGKTTIGYGGS
jgi:glutaredoxin